MLALYHNNINDSSNIVRLGSYGDVCDLCMQELIRQEKIPQITAMRKLAGKLEGKYICKIKSPFNYEITLCYEHVELINKQLEAKHKNAQTENTP